MVRVLCITSDEYLWALRPFAYLFNIYWSSQQPVIVATFSRPNFQLPGNFTIHKVANYNYPVKMWSNALIKTLKVLSDEYIIIMLEDYWLSRTVDVRGVSACHEYMSMHKDILRCDLTTDRLYASGMFDVESWGCYDIIETPHGTPYQMSFQAGIWNRQLLLELLIPGRTPWDVEIYTQPPQHMRVIGTRQFPVRYANAILKGKLCQEELEKIEERHLETIAQWIPPHFPRA